MSLVGNVMQGIENKGYFLSFLIQDGLGMTVPRSITGFNRDKDITGKYNIQEGTEVLCDESFNDLYSFLKNGIINSDNSFKNQTLYISHSDNVKDAKVCGEKIKEELGFKNVYYSYMGPSVISNIGPNFLALFFFKDKCI